MGPMLESAGRVPHREGVAVAVKLSGSKVKVGFSILAAVALVTGGSAQAQQAPEQPALEASVSVQAPPLPQPSPPAASRPSSATLPAGSYDQAGATTYESPSAGTDYQQDGSAVTATPIPPNVESAPYALGGGQGYCYEGPHPVDTRVSPGPSWDDSTGRNIRPYAPIDTRLFAYHNGCYYFVGDPSDFGYAGQKYSYYGAHPILDAYGGGWCFMMGPHTHIWAPWSSSFTVVGPWYYWSGAYDPFFWTYWPYYSFYYRSYYPHYYGGGRFYSHGGYRVAPPIRSVPASAYRGYAPGRTAGPVRGGPPSQAFRGGMQTGAAARPAYVPRAYGPATTGPTTGQTTPSMVPRRSAPAQSPSFGAARPLAPAAHPSFSPGPRPGFTPAPRPSFSPSRPSFSPSPHPSTSVPHSSGGFGSHGGGFHGGGHR